MEFHPGPPPFPVEYMNMSEMSQRNVMGREDLMAQKCDGQKFDGREDLRGRNLMGRLAGRAIKSS